MRRMLPVILALALAPLLMGQMVVVRKPITAAAGCTIGVACSTIKVWVNFEGSTATGDYTLGATECSDNSITTMTRNVSGAPTMKVSATGYRSGEANAIEATLTTSTSGDYRITSDIVPHDKGTICVDLKYVTVPSANNYVLETCDTGCLAGSFQITTGAQIATYFFGGWKHTTGSLSTGTAYVVRVSYDSTLAAGSDYVKTYINSTTASATSTGTYTAMGTVGTWRLGLQTTANSGAILIEKAAVSTDPAWDCYTDWVTNGIKDKQTGMCDG